MQYKISQDMHAKLIDFCVTTDKMNDASYNSRGQHDVYRRLCQNYAGKIGELFVNDYFGMEQSDYIMTILPKGILRSDIKWNNRGWGIKTQDEESQKKNGKNRFVFHSNDKFKSAVYCGLLLKYNYDMRGLLDYAIKQIDGPSPYDRFINWTNAISDMSIQFGFVCRKTSLVTELKIGDDLSISLNDGLWDEINFGLKKKIVLKGNDIKFEDRIDYQENFPKSKIETK